jgi:hypothetical protein
MQSTNRPIGVWIILVLHAVALVQTLHLFWLIYNERTPVSGAAAEYLQSAGALTRSLTVIGLMLTVAFLVALFRMRRVAITIFTANLVLAAISNLWFILFQPDISLFTAAFLVPVVVGLTLLGVIYLYLRALVQVGRLT